MLNLENITYDIEQHPFIVALGVFIAVVIGVTFLKKNAVPTHVTSATPTGNTYNYYPDTPVNNQPVNNPPVNNPPVNKPPVNNPPVLKFPINPIVPTTSKYVIVTPFPSLHSTLSGIASDSGITLARIEQLNPQYSSNWNLIHVGDSVRVS